MTDSQPQWIVIPNWDKFQHYRDRDPTWIKNHRSLLHSDAYRNLSYHQRGVLHGLWLEYAAANRQIRDSTLTLTRQLGQRVSRRDLETLNHAGFIEFSASKPLAPRYHDASPEKEKEREKKSPISPYGERLAKLLDHAQTVLANTGDIERAMNYLHNQPALSHAEREQLEHALRNGADVG